MVGAIIRYNRLTGDRVVRVYEGPDGYRQAVRDKQFLSHVATDGNTGPWELVVLGSDSMDTLKLTHSRYFSGHDITALQEA